MAILCQLNLIGEGIRCPKMNTLVLYWTVCCLLFVSRLVRFGPFSVFHFGKYFNIRVSITQQFQLDIFVSVEHIIC